MSNDADRGPAWTKTDDESLIRELRTVLSSEPTPLLEPSALELATQRRAARDT